MADDRVIPNATLGTTPGNPSSPANSTSDSSSSQPSHVLFAARDTVIPIVYGGPEQSPGKLYFALDAGNELVIVQILCEGPIQAVTNFTLNDQPWPNPAILPLPTVYLGTQSQVVDSFLHAIDPTFTETLAGTAYIVARIPRGQSQGFPRIKCQIQGLKVFDPRTAVIPLSGASGAYVSTPDSAALSAVGDVTFDVLAAAGNWASGSGQTLVGQRPTAASAANCGYVFRLTSAGNLELYWSTNGTTITTATSTVATGFANGAVAMVRATRKSASGNVEFYTSSDYGRSWTQLGTTLTGFTTNPIDSTAAFEVGGYAAGTTERFGGNMQRVQIYNGYRGDGLLVGNLDAWADASGAPQATGLTSIFASSGETWTCHGSGVATVTSIVFSDNPALCLGDFLSNKTYGARKTMNWPSVAKCADYDDQIVGTTPNTEKRNLLSITLGRKQKVNEWVNTLRAYVPCWVTDENGLCVMIPDAARNTDHTFIAGDIDQTPLPTVTKRGIADIPNVVQIGYTRTDVEPWTTAYAEVTFGTPTVRRISRVDFPGIKRYSQAIRFATEQLNHYNIENLEAQIGIFDYGLKVTLGDVCSVTDDIGLANKLFRVVKVTDAQHGRWRLNLKSYDATSYSGTVQTAPASPEISLADPKVVAAPTGLIINETVYLEKDPAVAGNIALGLIYQSRFDCSWTAPTHAFPFYYRVEVLDGTTKIQEANVNNNAYSTPPVQQGKSYTVKVYTRNILGYESTSPLTLTKIAQGKLLQPGPVPNITSVFQSNGEVLLAWDPAVDLDVIRYEWRYFPNGTGTWDTATFIDRVDGLRARFKGLPIGTHRFYVRAIDSVGQYSTSDKTADITVTTDSNAFVTDHEFTNPFIISAELVVNGDFSTSTGWNLAAGTTIGSGLLNINWAGPGSSSNAYKDVGTKRGGIYKYKFSITNYTTGSVYLFAGTQGNGVGPFNAVGTYEGTLDNTDGVNIDSYIIFYVPAAATLKIDNFTLFEVSNIVSLPPLEGIWKSRWATGFPQDKFTTSEPNPFTSGGNAVISYHTSARSVFRGESWDLGLVVAGDVSLTADVTAVSGSAVYYIESSSDGTTWTKNPGIAIKATARFLRPVIESLTGTLRWNSPPRLSFAALTTPESGVVTTSASNPTLVALSGKYISAQDTQATPINTTSPRYCVIDRIALYPQLGLLLSFTFSGVGSGNAVCGQTIFNSTYTIGAGDYLEYDVWIDPGCPPAFANAPSVANAIGSVYIHDQTAATYATLFDTITGDNIRVGTGNNLDVRGQWCARKIHISADITVGHVINEINFLVESGLNGNFKVLMRNLRITDGAGTDRQAIFPTIFSSSLQTNPQANINTFNTFASNVLCAPANTFNLYAFNNSGTQVATDARWSFRGF